MSLTRMVARTIMLGALLSVASGPVWAGKSRAQFGVTLKVISKCSVSTSAIEAAADTAGSVRASASGATSWAVDTQCTHGGSAAVSVEGVQSARALQIRQELASRSIVSASAPAAHASDASHDPGTDPDTAPPVITVTF